jgi:hypothetical protein
VHKTPTILLTMTHLSGEEVLYREWRYPSIPLTILVIAFIGMLAIAYSAAFDPVIGIGIFIICVFIALLAIWNYSPRIEIRIIENMGILFAGPAQLPACFISDPQFLDADAVVDMRRGTGVDSAYWMLRGHSPAIGFQNTDPMDPHEMWIIATRHPDKFHNALILASSPTN